MADVSAKARRTAVRFVSLYAGLMCFALSVTLMVRARLGLSPWDVLHQGIAKRLGVQLGWVVVAVSALVLLAWIPLRQRPGIGTVTNAVLIGPLVNVFLALVPPMHAGSVRVLLLVAGVGLNGIATSLYIGSGLGPGPRDGLMTGIAARGHSLRVVRSLIEGTVLLAGLLLGGPVGIGTVLYAVSIGPIVHQLLPRVARGIGARPATVAK